MIVGVGIDTGVLVSMGTGVTVGVRHVVLVSLGGSGTSGVHSGVGGDGEEGCGHCWQY